MKYRDKKLGRLRLDTLRDLKKRQSRPGWVNSPRVIKMWAKYKGVCVSCGEEIAIGSKIRYNLELKVAKHFWCE